MKMNEFTKKVCCAVEKELGSGYRLEIREVRKNNGVVLHGLLIASQERNVIPTIYLDSFWEAYEAGTPFSAVVKRLLSIYREDTPEDSVSMEFFQVFDTVRERVCYRLVGIKNNEDLLKDVPHIEFLDLAICFYYAYQEDSLGEGIILIHNSHMQMWGTSTAELLRLAQSNTPRLFPWECCTMEDILNEVTGRGVKTGCLIPMRVLSNVKRLHGAVCMLYPGVLEELAAELKGSFYIIPSSIHEVIVLADSKAGSAQALKEMIREVNSTQVAPEEVLSDTLYYYHFSDKKIMIASNENFANENFS